jgi:hypothetical protein
VAKQLAELTLDNVCGGALRERFEHALQQVLENIADPNTPADAVRAITIQIAFKPPKDSRERAAVKLQVTAKLAPRSPVADVTYLGRKDGRLVAVAFDPRQLDAFRQEPDASVVPLTTRKEAP